MQDAILEPKPKIRPPVMIADGGEQLTLRVVPRLGDACNVSGDRGDLKRKFSILRQHCDNEQRNYDTIERTNIINLLVTKGDASLAAKCTRLNALRPFRGFAGTVSAAIDLIGSYRDAGVETFICSTFESDRETLELIPSDIISHFA